ncbi:MAG: YbaK/EbsC family protein [Propionicimonas sp.]
MNPVSTPATLVLDRAQVAYRVHSHPPARNQAELHLTGLDVATSAKTLAFVLPSGQLALAAIPGAARLRYANLARTLGVPRSALKSAGEENLSRLGMQSGGVCPISDDPTVQVVLDVSLLGHRTLYCGSGLPEATIELAAADLVRISPNTLLADLCGE